MAEPIQINCGSACTVTVVHDLSIPPFQLSLAEGAQIASAILAVWAVAWGIRTLIRVLNSDGNPTSESQL